MTLINDLTTLVQALLQVTPPTVEANAEAAEKKENMKTKKQKNEKKEKVAVGYPRYFTDTQPAIVRDQHSHTNRDFAR